ncbi:MAG: DUF3368 domain-containing protein [Bacteroidota bacterium]|nr:DUF3368 domain-containing protein [Bacteroidota bacterium]
MSVIFLLFVSPTATQKTKKCPPQGTFPVITLLTISKLELLKELYGKLIIPQGVIEEIEEGQKKDFYTDLSVIDWIDIKSISDREPLRYISDLDKGEAEVIVLANELKADLVIIDEKLGREYATHFNLKLTGTVGVLV